MVDDASWMEVMKEKSAPTKMPFHTSGIVTSRNTRSFEAPTLSAASSMDGCTSRSDE